MGIDRPDEDDAPDVEPDSPAVEPDSPSAERDSPAEATDTRAAERDTPAVEHDASADPDARAAYNVEFRANVAAEYRAAWAEAVPALREAWEEHGKKYPRPEQSRPTLDQDGSWHGDGNRELSPEQNAEVDRGCERIREVGKEVIESAMRRIEAEDPDRHLIGFDNRFKEPDRIKEKVAGELQPPSKLTAAEAFAAMPDTVRFTLCYGESGYADGVRADTERLKAQGFELATLKNTWTKDQYKGINSQWRERESGVRFEVQFHTPMSFEAKELSHKAYERLRIPETSSRAERRELRAFQRQVCAKMYIPPGATDIEDYPPEKRDG